MIDPNLMAEAQEATARVPTDADLKSIAFLAAKQQRLEAEVEADEKALKQKQADLARVAELELPDAMRAVGMSEFVLENGYRVITAKEYYANIPSASSDSCELQQRRADAFEWLRDNGHEALIKHEVTVSTGKGEDDLADKAKKALEEAGIAYNDTESVHASTLKAFVREQLERPDSPLPQATFGVHVKTVATIKAPNKARKKP